MLSLLAHIRTRRKALIAFLKQMVECESPSDNPAAVHRLVTLIADYLSGIATVRTFPGGSSGPHLRCEFLLPGRPKQEQILVLGHTDTVWPIGTLSSMPWRQSEDRLWGPGVFDMKSGIAFFVFAMRALIELDLPVTRKVVLQLNSDEEIGSPSSRLLTEREARRSMAVLVVEPAAGLSGAVKTARKGVGDYHLAVHGVAAHAGLDFPAGASAILELARQIEVIQGFTRLDRGVTVNVGVVRGGTRSNVIAAEAHADVDIRVARLRDYAPLDRKFRRLKPSDPRCRIQVTGCLNRPPLERTAGVRKLYGEAKRLAADLGVELDEASVGGGSDGNFTAGLGIPTLDGLGGVGEGAHAPHESILEERIDDRVALLAGLVRAI